MNTEATIKIHRRWNYAGAIRKFTLFTKNQRDLANNASRLPPTHLDHVFMGRQTPSTHTRETDIQQLSLQIPQSNCTLTPLDVIPY